MEGWWESIANAKKWLNRSTKETKGEEKGGWMKGCWIHRERESGWEVVSQGRERGEKERERGWGCCFKISMDECVYPLGRGPVGSLCLSFHSFMSRSEGEVKATVFVCVWGGGGGAIMLFSSLNASFFHPLPHFPFSFVLSISFFRLPPIFLLPLYFCSM